MGCRHRQHDDIGDGASGGVFCAGDLGLRADFGFDLFGGGLGALRVSRADDDGFSGLRPAEGEAEAFGTGPAQDGDGAGHIYANSGSRDRSMVKGSGCCLMVMRV